jgi:hypothetical protein
VFGETYFAGGILLTIVGWIWLGLIESAFLRAVTRSGLIAVCMTPSIIGGHGIGVVHAIVLLFSRDYSKIGLVPNLVIWIVSFLVILSHPGLRVSKTQRPLRFVRELLNPPYFKLFLYGTAVFLLVMGNQKFVENWYVSVVVMFGGILLNYVLCMFATRLTKSKSWLLALPFAIPILSLGGYYASIVWFLAGVAGAMVGINEKKKALLMGALASTFLLLSTVQSTISAIKFKDTPHITISGGILGNGILAGMFFTCSILFWVFLWKYKRQ